MSRKEELYIGRKVCLLPEDVKAFEQVLLAAFPDMRFLCNRYWRYARLIDADGRPANGDGRSSGLSLM